MKTLITTTAALLISSAAFANDVNIEIADTYQSTTWGALDNYVESDNTDGTSDYSGVYTSAGNGFADVGIYADNSESNIASVELSSGDGSSEIQLDADKLDVNVDNAYIDATNNVRIRTDNDFLVDAEDDVVINADDELRLRSDTVIDIKSEGGIELYAFDNVEITADSVTVNGSEVATVEDVANITTILNTTDDYNATGLVETKITDDYTEVLIESDFGDNYATVYTTADADGSFAFIEADDIEFYGDVLVNGEEVITADTDLANGELPFAITIGDVKDQTYVNVNGIANNSEDIHVNEQNIAALEDDLFAVVEVVAESNDFLLTEIEAVDTKVDAQGSFVYDNMVGVAENKADVATLDGRIDVQDKVITTVTSKLENKANKGTVKALRKEVKDNTSAIATVETATADLKEAQVALIKDVADGAANVVELAANVEAAKVSLALAIETEATAREEADAVLAKDIGTNTTNIQANSNQISSNTSAIANNSARIDAVSAQSAAALNALASAPVNGVGVAIGSTGDSAAIAVGVKKQLSDRWTFSASASYTSNQSTQFGIGFGFTF